MITLSCFNWVQLIKKSDLPANAKFIALYLGTFMNAEHDIAWPSQNRIAHETGLSRSTVVKYLDYLEKFQWLIKRSKVHHIHTLGGPQPHNEYLINVPEKVVREAGILIKGCPTGEQRLSDWQQKDVRETDTNNNINNKFNNKRGNFVPPSVEQVREYCQKRGNNIDPEAFVAFYESNGWKVSKNPMKSWTASVITWEKRNRSQYNANQQKAPRSAAERVRANCGAEDTYFGNTIEGEVQSDD